MPRVGWLDSPLFDAHDAGASWHPEHPQRLEAVRRGVREAELADALVTVEPRPATLEELLRVHAPAHVEFVLGARGRSVQIDPDTAMGPRSSEAAVLAAGAVAEAVARVLDGSLDRAFCSVRPPGHHATRDRAMGFCLLNNVAVGAAAALAHGLERVAVLDFDVHHGNGTQEIFWEDPRVLFVSSHQFPFYPGTGDLGELGGGAGDGFTVNLPLPAGCGDAAYARVYREIVLPVVRAYDPQLVLVSAGFDAAAGDPLAGMRLSPAGFASLADACVAAADGAARGRLVAVLEGGYSEAGLALGSAALVGRMLDRPATAPPPEPSAPVDGLGPLLAALRRAQGRRWPAVGRG